MNVGYRMTKNPITVKEDTSVFEAQEVMRREKIHHLPVLDKNKKLTGIVTEKDLLYAAPSPASTLNVYEMTSLLAKLNVASVMSKKIISVTEDTPIEDAARIMSDNNIGGLPVMNKSELIGIITESDLFRVFIELFGARVKGIRITLLIPEVKGELAKITSKIAENGGNIISCGSFLGDDLTASICTLKIEGIKKETLLTILEPIIKKVIDVREV